MSQSEILERDHRDVLELAKRMTPEQRLVAYFHHAQLIYQLYQAGVRYRAEHRSPSRTQVPRQQ